MHPARFQNATLSLALVALFSALPQPGNAADYALSGDGNAVIRITEATTLSSGSFKTSTVTSSYPGWTVSTGATAGSFSTTSYSAGWNGLSGGASFTGQYTQATPVVSGHQLHFVQFINTNVPLGGATSPYIDPQPNDDTLPFYWTTSEVAGFSTPNTVRFSDFSKRGTNSLTEHDTVTWSADLYPVEYDGTNGISVRDGVRWGWEMKPATIGAATGTFNAPAPTCPPARCSGLGTSTVSWGTGQPGSLTFEGASFAPVVGELFKLGTLTYHNGSTTVGSAIDGVDLDIALTFENVAEANFTYNTRLSINNTINTNDPIASADFVSFVRGSFSESFNVEEGRTASVDLMAKLTPTLGVSTGGGGDKDPFGVPDTPVLGFGVELAGFANPTVGGFVSAVPEPEQYAMFGLGLLVVLAHTKKRRNIDARK